MTPIESVEHGLKKVVYRKQKRENKVAAVYVEDDEIAARDEKKVVSRNTVAVYVEDESSGAGAVRSKRGSNCYGEEIDEEIVASDENLEAEEKQQVSFSEAAEKISPSSLEISLIKISKTYSLEHGVSAIEICRFLWERTFRCAIFMAGDVQESTKFLRRCSVALYGGRLIKCSLFGSRTSRSTTYLLQISAMVLRCHPYAFDGVFPILREVRYQGPHKLPFIVWMMAQASLGDLAVGLSSWAHYLLPLVGFNSNPLTRDLILQLVEKILSDPNAQTMLVDEAVRMGQPVIPPPSFEILLRLIFPASSARAKATERFEAIYPLLNEVALAGVPGSKAMKQVTQQIFTFSLKSAQEGNPVLAKEATAIAIWCVTENVDCCKHWGSLYKENLEASVAFLKKLVDEWKDHSLKLSSSKSDTFTLIRTMQSFRLKNEKAITEGGANGCLYKEADESCKVILGRLSRGSDCIKVTANPRLSHGSSWLKGTASPRLSLGSGWLKGTTITAVVLAAAGVLSFNLEATTHWIRTYSSL